jgi:MinD superfamily P-loop ATPase
MTQIVVMSGKGGTGKTSITAALGQLAEGGAVIADCDVDASNLPLLLRPEVQSEELFYGGTLPTFDMRTCSMCGHCESACAWDAIVIRNGRYAVDEYACEGCGICSHVCPEACITMVPRVTGIAYTSRTRFDQPMAHAHLHIGQENSGKLVTRTKTDAVAMAERENKQWLIVDGPPGIGCPAIAALSGATVVLIVTESTRAGLHDMTRLVQLLQATTLPAVCLINKCDLDEDIRKDIHRLCENSHIPVVAELPWSELFPESLRQGATLLEMADPEVSSAIGSVWTYFTTKETRT